MLSPAEAQILGAFKRALADRFGERLVGLRLFGSRARGAGRDDSDLDVIVDVADATMGERGEILDVAADLSVEHGLVLSPLVLREGAGRVRDEILREAVPL